MVYDFYSSRRGYSSRPIVSSYSYSPYFDRSSFYDGGFGTSYSSYYSPMRVTPSYSSVGRFMSRPSFSFSYESKYADVPYGNIKRVISVPITRITTSPSRVYRERSEVRVLTPSARIYRRDVSSPARVITSPARICNIRVRPSVLSREFGRIDRKYRSSPFGLNDTEEYLNSTYATNFDDETRDIRASSRRLLKEIHEPVPRPQGLRFGRAQSLQPTYSRFDSDLIDRYGNSLIDNEFHVSKNIIRPTRKTRDQIEILSHFKYPESAKRYTVKLGLDPARPSRKFNEVKEMEDPAIARKEVEALKAANRLGKVQEVDEDLEKIKQKRIEERKLREQQALMEDKVHEKERAKKEEADRQAELQRQERLAAQAAAERQAEIERKAAEEAKVAEEARLQEEAKQAEAKKAAQAAQDAESAKLAEESRLAAEAAAKKQAEEDKKAAEAKAAEEAAAKAAEEAAAKKAEEERLAKEAEEAARLAEEAAAKKAEEERLAELEKLKEDEAKLNELERLANEDEEVELARQANELAEIARQQTEELQSSEPAAETPAEPTVEAPATPEITEEPIVEAPESPAVVVEESPAVEELETVVEESAAEVAVEEPAAEE